MKKFILLALLAGCATLAVDPNVAKLPALIYQAGDVVYWTLNGSTPTLSTPNRYTVPAMTAVINIPGVTVSSSVWIKSAVYRPSTQQWSRVESSFVYVDVALPITLVRFVGINQADHSIRLEWATLSETQNYGFQIERNGWLLDTLIQGHGTTNEPHEYAVVDRMRATDPAQVRYRLKQIDLDGTSWYSDQIVVRR
jgi:hypothetical protein